MGTRYEIATRGDKGALSAFLAREGQLLLPMVELVERAELAVDELIEVMGRATIEAVLQMSAEQVAGPKRRGRRDEARSAHWYGSQPGRVSLSDRKLRVERPRLRRKGGGRGAELVVPAYEAMRSQPRRGERMLEILLAGVSTRKDRGVVPEMAETVGIAKSSVSREMIEASEEKLRQLLERRFEDVEILIVYLDGLELGPYHVLAAVGVDAQGKKHVLGLREGASENAEVARALLEDLVERGVKSDRRRLFVIDGSKALRKAIEQVYGSANPVQRCRNHKIRNVLSHLPKEKHDQVRAAMRAAWKLEQLACWLQREHPSAAESLREGLQEMFTINRLDLPASLRRCLGSTNLIDSTHSGVRQKMRRVTNWRSGQMALRWTAAAFLATEKSYRKILGHDQLWMLRAHLDQPMNEEEIAQRRKIG